MAEIQIKKNKEKIEENNFQNYFDFKFEKSDPNTFFSRLNFYGSAKNIPLEYIKSHNWENLDAFSFNNKSSLKIEYLVGEEIFSYENKLTHLAYFETSFHKMFARIGLGDFSDNIYVEDKIIENARKKLREKDIFGSAGDSLVGTGYTFDSQGRLKGFVDFVKTILESDLTK